MPRIIVALALSSLVLASCKTEARKRAEIRNCSAISFDAPGIARCLVAQYRWKQSAAAAAGQARQHELDSIATVQRDSLWRIDAARHREELSRCAAAGGDVSRCLQENFAWDPDRAGATFDSVWRAEGTKHHTQFQACARQRASSIGSCLMLYYKWDPKHALALDDSIARAKIRALNSR